MLKKQIAQEEIVCTRIRQKLEEFQFSKFELFGNLDSAIFLMGTSRAGKSSLFLMLQEINLQSKKMNGPIVLESSNEQYKDIIGHGATAKTKMPNIAEISPVQINGNDSRIHYFVVDCPGLLDSEGFQDDFTNSYFVMKVFEIVKKARFLLCIQQSEFKGNMDPLVKSLQGFLKYFKKNTPNLKQIINATSLVITQTYQFSSDAEGVTVGDYLEDIRKNLQKRQLVNHSILITELIKSNKVYYQPKARKVQKQFSQQIGKQIKQKQLKNKFYQINKEQDIDFEFDCQKNSNTAKQFDQMHSIVARQLQRCGKILVQCFNETVENNSKQQDQKTRGYHQKINQFLATKDIYKSVNNLQGRRKKLQQNIEKKLFKEQLHDFSELIFLRNINEAVTMFFESTNPQHVKSLLYAYVNNILNYLYVKHDTKSIQNLAYLIKRNFEELKIIEKIKKNVTREYVSIHSVSQISSNFSLKQQQHKFVRNYTAKNQKKQQFLKQASNFFDTFKFQSAIKNIQINIKDKQNQLSIANNKKTQLTKKVAQLQGKIKKQTQATAQLVKVQADIVNNGKQKDQLQKKIAQLQSKLAEKPQNQTEITKGQTQIATKENQKIVLEAKVSQLQNTIKDKTLSQTELTKVQPEVTNSNSLINTITAQLKTLNNQKAKQQKVERIRQKILIDFKYQQAKIYQLNQNWLQAFKQYESCRKITQKFNELSNAGSTYKIVNIQLYQSLGRLCEEQLNSFGLAIQYFKVINHYLSIRRCYQKYRNFCSDNEATNVFIQNACFLSEIGQHKAAQQLLWTACQKVQANQIQQMQKVQRLKKQQLRLQKQKNKANKLYLKKIEDNDFFKRPNQKLIQQLKQKDLKLKL